MGLCCCKEKTNIDEGPKAGDPSIAKITREIPPSNEPFTNESNSKAEKKLKNRLNNLGNLEIYENEKNYKGDDLIRDFENADYPLIQKPNISFYDQIKGQFYLRIYIENLEIFYKQCDEFGLVFKPYIEIFIPEQNSVKFTNIDEEKLNHSGITDDHSFTSDYTESTRFKSQPSFNNSQILNSKDGKIFLFKSSKNYCLPKGLFYNSVLVSVRNEPSFNQSLPPIVIGESRIPINMLANKFNDNNFDGLMEVKLRNTTLMGHLKLVLTVSLNSFEENGFMKKYTQSNKNLVNEDFDLSVFSKQASVWDKNLLHYNDIDPEIIENYFIFDTDTREKHLDSAKQFFNKVYEGNNNLNNSLINQDLNFITKNLDGHFIYKNFKESISKNNENIILLYELFICLLKLSYLSEYNTINDFFKILSAEEKQEFYSLPLITDYNVNFIRIYLIFISSYQKYYKSNKSINIRNNKALDDISILNKMLELIKKIDERSGMNKQVVNEEYSLELRECLLWCLYNIQELISQPSELLVTKSNKIQIDEQKIKEFSIVYDNCLHLISNRFTLLKILEHYLNNSQIISAIFRIFRKIIQVLTNDSHSLIDKSKEPKVFSRELRKLLISQNDGFFITTIRAILSKYYHYPELHNNLLIILFQITNYSDSTNLALAANKLNMDEFKEVFDPYRSKLRVNCKLLNNMHLSILANISDVCKHTIQPEHEQILKSIMLNLKAYYRNTPNCKKRLEDFKNRKLLEVELHEIITRIGINITKFQKLAYSLLESNFYDDIIEYLIVIAKTKTNGRDFIHNIIDTKKKSPEEVKRYTVAIVENSQSLLINIMNVSDEDISDAVCNQILTEHEIEDAGQLSNLIDECKMVLKKHGCNVNKIEHNMQVLLDMFEVE